nr:uncharacterized mitochondrial protein AtMg00810-like [Tanacetum cinerariifolium]
MIGSLMYLTSSRPDIMFATCMCARYQANPNEHHVSAIKRIFLYLKGTINLGLWYLKDSGFDLTAYLDADHAGCHLDRKITSDSVQFLGDKLVCLSSKKQNYVSISTAKSEYVDVSGCYAQVLWMPTQLMDYGFFFDKVLIYCDSKSAIAISCNPGEYLYNDRKLSKIKFSSSYDVSEDDEKQKREIYYEEFMDMVMWIGSQITNELIFLNHNQVSTIDNKVVINIGSNNDRARSRCYSLSTLPHGLIIRIENYLFGFDILFWFLNHFEEQIDGEAMINCIKHGDQPLPHVIQVSIAGTSSTEQPPLKDKFMWRDVNDVMGLKNKTIVVTSDPLALIAEKMKVSKRKEKVVVSSNSEGSDVDDFSELKKITALLTKAFNRRKFYSKLTNNNLRTLSASQSTNKKQEYVKSDDKKVEKKDDEKKRDMSKVKFYNCKKEDHAWMESRSDLDQEINANMVFMAQIEKVLSDSEASSSSADNKISKVSYYLSESESESEYETSEYYDKTTTYGLFVNDNDDQEIFHDCENFPENLIESQINHNESAVDHNDSEGIDKLIREFNKKIAKCLKCIEKAINKKDFENQNKDLQDKYDVLKNQTTTFEMKNNELNEQVKVLVEKNDDLLDKMNVLKDQLQVKHVVIDTHVEYFDKIDSSFQQISSFKPYVLNVILEKIIIDLEDEVVSLLDKEKGNLKTIEFLKSKDVEIGVESSEKVVSKTENKSENDWQVIEKVCDSEENPNVISPGMFKLSVSQSVLPICVTNTYCASNSVENLDTLSSVRRTKPSGVM